MRSGSSPLRRPSARWLLALCLAVVLTHQGCGTTPKGQIRGTDLPPPEAYEVGDLEVGNCHDDGNRLACDLWPNSIEEIDRVRPLR